jgi:pilus assembly protein FimV
MPHFVMPALSPDAVAADTATPAATAGATATAHASASPSATVSASASATATSASPTATPVPTPTPAPAANASATAATHQATAHATAAASSGGSGHWWLWLLLGVLVALVAGMAIFRFVYVRSRRQGWPDLAMNAYQRGTALVAGLKSGQTRTEFTMYANDYDSVLRYLQERSPGESARWTVARVAAALEAVRQAVDEHPGSDLVRTSVADLEGTLGELRDSALVSDHEFTREA